MPLSGDNGVDIVDAGEVFAGISDLQELEIGAHVIQLHREILRLHLDFENLPQIANRLIPAQRQKRDILPGIISRGKERKALDVVPVKVGEHDKNFFLLVADGEEVSAQISQSCARVKDGDAVRIRERDLQASGVAAELLKPAIADGDGSARTVKLELHTIVFMNVSPRRASSKVDNPKGPESGQRTQIRWACRCAQANVMVRRDLRRRAQCQSGSDLACDASPARTQRDSPGTFSGTGVMSGRSNELPSGTR
jgi:hypothetical protein